MTASEFAFMALGLVLGGASGAALVFVIGSRPPAPREIRLTVGQDAIPRRVPATLSNDALTSSAAEPARGGPADRRSADRHPGPVGTDRFATWTDEGSTGAASTPAVPVSAPAVLVTSSRVGIPIHREPDPALAAIRSGAPAVASSRVGADRNLPAPHGDDVPASADEPRWPERPPAVGAEPTPDRRLAAVAVLDDEPRPQGESGSRAAPRASGGWDPAPGPSTPPSRPSGEAGSGHSIEPPASTQNPCAAAESTADERCRHADVARLGAERATEAAATAQRDYDALRGQVDRARAASDPRALQELKESARAAFRAARRAATDHAGIDDAARTWLTTINQLNGIAREATHTLARAEAAAAALLPSLERLGAEADAARVTAEAAAAACREAGSALAACREAAANDRRAAEAMVRIAASGASRTAEPAPVAGSALPSEPASIGPDEPPHLGVEGRALDADGGTPVVIRIVQGDREARTKVAAALRREAGASDTPWADLLSEFAEGVRMRAIEASLIDLPADHPFWGQFAGEERREIVNALSALGYRFDGLGGWLDQHLPNQRDLSRAVGYAGQDPMRVRNWPEESDISRLLEDAQVATDEYLRQAGGDLSLGEVVDLLGARADSLTDLWDAWATVRPLLLAPAEDPGSV